MSVAIASGVIACGGGGGAPLIDPNSGRLSGEISITGPYDPDVQLRLVLRFAETGGLVAQSEVIIGRLPSSGSAFFSGQAIRYSYDQLFVGRYIVEVFSGNGAARRVWYGSPHLSPGFNGEQTVWNDRFSFSGGAPFGVARGEITLSGTWPERTVFLGAVKSGGDETLLRLRLNAADAVEGTLAFELPGLAYGSYSLGLYSSDSQGAVVELGKLAELMTLTAAEPELDGLSFTADLDLVT